VGEPIAEVHSEGGRIVVPVVCLIEAAREVGEEMPRVLLRHRACSVPPVTVETWPALAAGTRKLGRLDLAAALYLATMGEGYVLTAEPEAYGDLGEDSVIGI
jgi:hypothetical protein